MHRPIILPKVCSFVFLVYNLRQYAPVPGLGNSSVRPSVLNLSQNLSLPKTSKMFRQIFSPYQLHFATLHYPSLPCPDFIIGAEGRQVFQIVVNKAILIV